MSLLENTVCMYEPADKYNTKRTSSDRAGDVISHRTGVVLLAAERAHGQHGEGAIGRQQLLLRGAT